MINNKIKLIHHDAVTPQAIITTTSLKILSQFTLSILLSTSALTTPIYAGSTGGDGGYGGGYVDPNEEGTGWSSGDLASGEGGTGGNGADITGSGGSGGTNGITAVSGGGNINIDIPDNSTVSSGVAGDGSSGNAGSGGGGGGGNGILLLLRNLLLT